MLPTRIYQFKQTGIPEEAKMIFHGDFEEAERLGGTIWEELDYDVFVIQQPGWAPKGWREHVERVRAQQIVDGVEAEKLWDLDRPFSWPWSDRLFKSRSAAMERVNAIRHWGGTAELVEASLVWETTKDANARRKAERDRVRIQKLKAKIHAIQDSTAPVRF